MNDYEKTVEDVIDNVAEELIDESEAPNFKLSKWGLFKDLTCLVADLSAATTMAVLIKSHRPEPTNLKHRGAF